MVLDGLGGAYNHTTAYADCGVTAISFVIFFTCSSYVGFLMAVDG